jgi:molecular chaperone HtpG
MAKGKRPVISDSTGPIAFQTEIKQLLDILIHSLYTRKEIFLRELLSNASDALTQMRFLLQTDQPIHDPALELEIKVEIDQEQGLLKVSDTGIGMTAEEMRTNLGTIAQSGAKAFLEAAQGQHPELVDVIGRFGVGFYSVFMVADWVKVSSRSYQPDQAPASWYATGADTFEMGSSDQEIRGTVVEIKLKKDAREFADSHRIREIIKTHSDYIPFPIYIGEDEKQANRQKAIWRDNPREVSDEDYQEFYHQLTLEMNPPLDKIHLVADAPLMIYALLYFPAKLDRGLFTLREQDGLKLYSRKVLIEDYSKDLLPPYLRFIQGVVDAEDLPLNVSRESVQATAVINRLKKILSNEVIKKLKQMAKKSPETYQDFWTEFGQFIKEGIASNEEHKEELAALLRFHTTTLPDRWSSLDDYLEHVRPGQDRIYYILGDDEHAISRSPHLDYFQTHCYEVLMLTDPVDPFLLLGLREYKDFTLQNVADSDLKLPEAQEEETEKQEAAPEVSEETRSVLVKLFKDILGEKVSEVRVTDRLTSSVARLIDIQGSPGQEVQRVYRMMDRDFQDPKKILEINPAHPLLLKLSDYQGNDPDLTRLIVEQIYDSTLLIEGMHPDPASMIPRIQQLMDAALKGK